MHRLKVLQFNDSSGRSVLCKTAEQLLEFLFNMEQEVWKPVVWYEELYEISSTGNVKSLRYKKTKNVSILSPYKNKYGYTNVCLKNRKTKCVRVHRLVSESFIPNPQNKPQVNHKNGIKDDNRVENLEWCTASENQKHAYKNWLKRRIYWAESYLSKKVMQYSKNWNFIKEWGSLMDIKRELWINQWNISSCCTWKLNHTGWYVWRYELLPINH